MQNKTLYFKYHIIFFKSLNDIIIHNCVIHNMLIIKQIIVLSDFV